MNRIMSKDSRLYTSNIGGYAYIKNSEGKTANLILHTICYISTEDNSAMVKYNVKAFEPKEADYFNQDYTDYSQAVDKYNELLTSWSGYR